MSLWGAEPLHPRVRRTQGSEVAAGRAEEGPAKGVGWRPGGRGAVRKGSQLVTREPRGFRGCEESPKDCSHASQLRQQRLQLQPLPPSWQTGRVPLPSLLPSDSPGGMKTGTGFLVLPRLLRSEGVAGGISRLLDSGHGVCNQAEPVGRDPDPSAHSAKAPLPPRPPGVPMASALTWIPTP